MTPRTAGFQLAAAWLGVVDRIWWLRPGGGERTESTWSITQSEEGWPEVEDSTDAPLEEAEEDIADTAAAVIADGKEAAAAAAPGNGASAVPESAPHKAYAAADDQIRRRPPPGLRTKLAVRTGPLTRMDDLEAWRSPTQAYRTPHAAGRGSHATATENDLPPKSSPHILDIDLDFWGGAAGPLPPPWEIPPLQSCGDYFREHGAAAWADPRFGKHTQLWPVYIFISKKHTTKDHPSGI